MKTSDVLKAARELLAKPGGWIQGAPNNRAGGYCVIGALLQVDDPKQKSFFLVRNRAFATLHEFEPDLGKWNDQPGRTQAEVLDLYDRAIGRAEVVESAAA